MSWLPLEFPLLLLLPFDFAGFFPPLELFPFAASPEPALLLADAELSDEPESLGLLALPESDGVEPPDDAFGPESCGVEDEELLLSDGGGFEVVLFELCDPL